VTAAELYSLAKEPFLAVVTGHPKVARRAAAIAVERGGRDGSA
jgi:hypothetical protein